MTKERESSGLTPRLVSGLMVVALGLAFLGENLGYFGVRDLLRFWPFALIVIGLTKVLDGDGSHVGGWILIGLGGLFASENFIFVRYDVWRWWPLAIIFFGFLIISRAFGPEPEPKKGAPVAPPLMPGAPPPSPPPSVRTGVTDPKISELAIWSGIERRVSSPAFKRADLTAIMGGIEFDLRQASTADGEAVIEVFALWGGIEITVPPDWAVSNRVTAIMGGAEDSTSGTQQAGHRLIVKGVVLMGGIEIKT